MGQLISQLRPESLYTDSTESYDSDDAYDGVFTLPPEVVDMIIDHLPRQTIASCLRVNSLFYAIIRPRICSRLVVEPRPAGKGGLSCAGVLEWTPAGDDNQHDQAPAVDNSVRTAWNGTLTRRWLPQFVRCLELNPHESTDCACLADGQLPWSVASPGIVRLNLATEESQVLHLRDDADPEPCTALAAMSSIAPHTLVIHDIDAEYELKDMLPPALAASTKHMVYVLGPTFLGYQWARHYTLFIDEVPMPSIETITIIFACPVGSHWSPVPPDRPWSDFDAQIWLDRMLSVLVACFMGILDETRPVRTKRLSLVNITSIEQRYLPVALQDMPHHEAITKMLIDRAISVMPNHLRAALRLDTRADYEVIVRVVGFDEYLASVPPGMFADEEVAAWV